MPPGAVFMVVGFGQVGLAALGYAGVLVVTWIPRLYPYRQRLVGAVVGTLPGAMVGLAVGYALAIGLGIAAHALSSLRHSDFLGLVMMAIVAAGYLGGVAAGVVGGWRWVAFHKRKNQVS